MNTHNAAEVKNVAEMPLFSPFAIFCSRSNLTNLTRAHVCVCARLTPKCHEEGGGGVVGGEDAGMRHLISMATPPL